MVSYVLPFELVAVREYIDAAGRSPFGIWFDRLDVRAAAKANTALTRLSAGNFSAVKGVGSGLFECRIDFGPGYRIYFGKDGEQLVILVGGGAKARQQQDIRRALTCWQEYKRRKKEAGNGVDT
jgi:putative addiction module killer protein